VASLEAGSGPKDVAQPIIRRSSQGGEKYEITTRKSKIGNLIMEICNKDDAENLTDFLKTRLGGEI